MAGGSLYEDDEGGLGVISEINVTPLVDITLVLLIIFMVTAHFIVNRAIPGVQTPKAMTGEQVKSSLALTLDRSRVLYVNGQDLGGTPAVKAYLEDAVAKNPEIQAVITSDGAVPYSDFVGVIDLLRVVGIKRYALTVSEMPEEH
jgi:biopolymer transport protein TolR